MTVVLLHGFTGSPASWDAVVHELAAGTAVVRPALLGHASGEAGSAGSPTEEPTTFEGEVDRIAELLRASGVERGVVCGYSLGGRVALGLLVRHPQLFERAVLVGAHPGLADPAERDERMAQDERWARMLEREGLEPFVHAWERLPLFERQASLPEAVRACQRRIRLAHDPRGLARALRVLGLGRMPDYGSRLGAVRVPVRLVAGEADAKFRSLADAMAQGWGGPARAIAVPGAGHHVPLFRPAAVAAMIQDA